MGFGFDNYPLSGRAGPYVPGRSVPSRYLTTVGANAPGALLAAPYYIWNFSLTGLPGPYRIRIIHLLAAASDLNIPTIPVLPAISSIPAATTGRMSCYISNKATFAVAVGEGKAIFSEPTSPACAIVFEPLDAYIPLGQSVFTFLLTCPDWLVPTHTIAYAVVEAASR